MKERHPHSPEDIVDELIALYAIPAPMARAIELNTNRWPEGTEVTQQEIKMFR